MYAEILCLDKAQNAVIAALLRVFATLDKCKKSSRNGGVIIYALLIVCITACCEKESITTVGGSVGCISYNVAGLPDLLSSSHPATYSSSIGSAINRFDIVHLQEDFCYHDSIMKHNKHEYVTDPMPCVPDGDGLNTLSKYPISNFQRIAWTDCTGADCLTPKGFSYSQITIYENISIDFYNIHCNAGGSDESLAARRKNIKQLTDYIKIHSPTQAIIVMGDFNSRYTREGDTIRAMLDMGFSDAWVTYIRNGEVPPYGDKLKDCEPIGTNPNCEGIDKVFYRGNEQIALSIKDYLHGDFYGFTYNDIDSLPLSDHVPSYVQLYYDLEIRE